MPAKQEFEPANNRKRKNPPQDRSSLKNDPKRKRQRFNDARQIAVQTTSNVLQNGELDIEKFVRAREFEIKALEESMAMSKKALSNRAFQGVPRNMRRRTASHNVKRAPKRLRGRVAKEVRRSPVEPSWVTELTPIV
jgi:ribonuclease P/MRP protein subunit POP1